MQEKRIEAEKAHQQCERCHAWDNVRCSECEMYLQSKEGI